MVGWFHGRLVMALESRPDVRTVKYALLLPSSVAGGWVFAQSGSWLSAIQWDLWIYLIAWALYFAGLWLVEGFLRAVLWMWPLVTVDSDG